MTTEHIAKGLDQFLQDEFADSLKAFKRLRTGLQGAWDKEKQSKKFPMELAVGFLEKAEKVFSKRLEKKSKTKLTEEHKQEFLKKAREKLVQLDPELVAKIDFVKVFDECLSAEFKASSPVSYPPHFNTLKQSWDIEKNKSDLSPLQLGINFFMATRDIFTRGGFGTQDPKIFLNKVRAKLVQHDRALYFKIDAFYNLTAYEQHLKKDIKGSAELQEAAKNIQEMCLTSSDDIPELYKIILENVTTHLVNKSGDSEKVKQSFVRLLVTLGHIKGRYEKRAMPNQASASESVSAAAPVIEVKKQPTSYDTSPKKATVETHPRAGTSSSSFSQRAAKALNIFAQNAKELSEVVVEVARAEVMTVVEEAQDLVGIKSPTKSRDSSRESSSSLSSTQSSPSSSPARKKQAEPSSPSEFGVGGSPTGVTPHGSPKGSSPTATVPLVDPKIAEQQAAKDKLIGDLKNALETELRDEAHSAKSKQAVIKDLDVKIKAAHAIHVENTAGYNLLTQTIVREKAVICDRVEEVVQSNRARLSEDFRFAFRKSNIEKLDNASAALPSEQEQFEANCRASAESIVKGLLGGLLSRLPVFLGGNFFRRRLDARVDAAVNYLRDRKAQQEMRIGLVDQNAVAINNAANRFANVDVAGLVQHLGERTAKDAEVRSSHEDMQALIREKRECERPLQKAQDALLLLHQIKSNWSDIAQKLHADSDKHSELAHIWKTNNIYGRWKKIEPLLSALLHAPEQDLGTSAKSSVRLGQQAH